MVVNPYTFLPLRGTVRRERPSGHEMLRENHFSGRFTLTLTARTALSIGPLVAGGPMPPRRAGQGEPGSEPVIVPGSSLAGAIRAVHEALNVSCLRVIDPGYRAVHREPMISGIADGLELALVLAVDEHGLPTRVALCTDVLWMNRRHLLGQTTNGVSRPPRTGDRYDLSGVRKVDDHGRIVSAMDTDPIRPTPRGSWFLLVTDTRARHREREVWFVCGRPTNTTLQLSDSARHRFARAVEGTPDMAQEDADANVYWPPPQDTHHVPTGQLIGTRHVVRGLRPGLPVWIVRDPSDASVVKEVKPSVAWRRTSELTTGDRIPEGFGPCTKPDDLCPSCRIFGSAGADTPSATRRSAEQNSYRGHVRVDDAEAVGMPALQTMNRAPLAEPRPTAGQFYLDNAAVEGRSDARRPLAQWDSRADSIGSPRQIRGRKFYWRTAPPGEPAFPPPGNRGRKRVHHGDTQTEEITLIGAGASFSARVTFENLTKAQVGSLLAAADPGLVLEGDIVTSIGGGRPFGWGAVSPRVSELTIESALERYLGHNDSPAPTVEDCVNSYRVAATEAAAAEGWPSVQRILTLNPPGVSDGDVWYPPSRQAGARGSAEYDQGFDFWQGTSGWRLTKSDRPLQSLPAIDLPNQHLPWYEAHR